MFIKKEIDDQKEKTALEIARDLPINISETRPAPNPQPTMEKNRSIFLAL